MTAVQDLPPIRQATMFLSALAQPSPAGARIELRSRRSNGAGMAQDWIPAIDPKRAAGMAVRRGPVTDVYCGVAVRTHDESGGKDAVPAVRWLWADCDTPEAAEAAKRFEPRPPMVVRSSPGKGHCYWPLREWLAGDEADQALRRLAHALRADERCAERARILRIPGTLNHKHAEPQPVILVRFEPVRSFLAADVVGSLPNPEPDRDAVVAIRRPPRMDGDLADVLRGIPAEAYVPALTGREPARGYVTCPLHGGGDERTASLWVRGRPGHEADWHCFGCGEGGGIFDFAARLWGLDTRGDFPTLIERLTTELLGTGRAAA